jgi:hypothetical protein
MDYLMCPGTCNAQIASAHGYPQGYSCASQWPALGSAEELPVVLY